jgi:DNA-binding NarL/FixJ family response regulator
LKILIADDHAVVRKGLVQILDEARDIAEVDEADSGEEVLDLVRRNDYQVLVLDLNMPGMSGFQVLEQVTAIRENLPVLVLSMHSEDQYGVRVLRAGASGYVAKGTAPEELLSAVRRVAAGGKYISPKLAENLLSVLDDPGSGAPHERLSDREFQVFVQLADGATVSEIAEKLHLSAKTISTYRSRVLEKMSASSTAELVQYAVKNGLIQ